MLIEQTLFGERDKVEIALERIRFFEREALAVDPHGYYVCVSGGKDSSAIQQLCVMAGARCEFVHNHTSADHPETVRFVRREQERMREAGYLFRIEIPRFEDGRQKTMWNLIEKKGFPLMNTRWCCEELKEYGGAGRYCVTGVRWAESPRRKKTRSAHELIAKSMAEKISLNNDNDMKRKLSEICLQKRKFVLNPIIDWSNEDVWEFLTVQNVPVNPLYAEGYKRVGCIGCPMNRKSGRELEKLPRYKVAYIKAGAKYLAYRRERGLKTSFTNAGDYYAWWKYRMRIECIEQCTLFEPAGAGAEAGELPPHLLQADIFNAAASLTAKGRDGTGRATELLAKRLGVSASTIQHARIVASKAPGAVIDAVQGNGMSINKAYREIRKYH